MSVVIEELEVQVSDAPAPPAPSDQPTSPPRARMDLPDALELLHERRERLKAD